MTIAQLDLYNGALRLCGETKLASLSDNRKARYLLDDVWNEGAVNAMLEQGLWYFALRTSKFDADPNITPAFGYRMEFAKPSDWVRTAMLCQDESFNVPLTAVRDESGSWFADITPIYVSYVSNGNNYGNNFANWPASFINAFQGYLAEKIITQLTSDQTRWKDVLTEAKRFMTDARAKAAMNESALFPPAGSWTRARWGRRSGVDRGNTGQLIG